MPARDGGRTTLFQLGHVKQRRTLRRCCGFAGAVFLKGEDLDQSAVGEGETPNELTGKSCEEGHQPLRR